MKDHNGFDANDIPKPVVIDGKSIPNFLRKRKKAPESLPRDSKGKVIEMPPAPVPLYWNVEKHAFVEDKPKGFIRVASDPDGTPWSFAEKPKPKDDDPILPARELTPEDIARMHGEETMRRIREKKT